MQEVHRPPVAASGLSGKSDTIDAEHAARQVLTGRRSPMPKTAAGAVEALRLIKIAPDTAVKARTSAIITLKATLVTATDGLRGELEPLTDYQLIAACAALEPGTTGLEDPDAAMRHVLRSLAVGGSISTRRSRRTAAISRSRPRPRPRGWSKPSVSVSTSPRKCWSPPGITATESAPNPPSRNSAEPARSPPVGQDQRSSPTQPRRQPTGQRRALPRGHRPHALAPATIDYVARRTTEGLSKREIIRCLKRYLAREIYRLLPPPSTLPRPASTRFLKPPEDLRSIGASTPWPSR